MKPATGTVTEKELLSDSETLAGVRFAGSLRDGDDTLSPPSGFAFTKEGNRIVADDFNHRIQIYSPDGACIAQFGRKGKGPGEFHYPKGCAVDAQGHIYVADSWNHRVQQFDAAGRHLKTIGNCGEAKGQLNEPHDVVIDHAGLLHVVERYNHRIQIFDSNGVSQGFIGNRGTVLEEELAEIYETPAHLFAAPGFEFPTSLAAAPDGGWYVADSGNHRVVRFDALWQRQLTFGGRGSEPGRFEYPLCVAVAPNGLVYVTDLNNDRVQAFTATGGFLFDFNRCGKMQDLKAPNLTVFTPEGRLWVSRTFETAVLEFEVPDTPQDDILQARITACPQDTRLLYHQALSLEEAGNTQAALKIHRQIVTLLAQQERTDNADWPLACLMRFSRLARASNDPENTASLVEGLQITRALQQTARQDLLETHLEWEQAALDFNRRTFAEQKRVLAGSEDSTTFNKPLYAAEERDKTLYRKLRHQFFRLPRHRAALRRIPAKRVATAIARMPRPHCGNLPDKLGRALRQPVAPA